MTHNSFDHFVPSAASSLIWENGPRVGEAFPQMLIMMIQPRETLTGISSLHSADHRSAKNMFNPTNRQTGQYSRLVQTLPDRAVGVTR